MRYGIELVAYHMVPDGKGGWVCQPDIWKALYQRDATKAWEAYKTSVSCYSWDAAYAVLQDHANPTQLALFFVGMFEQDAINEKQEWYRRIGASHGQ